MRNLFTTEQAREFVQRIIDAIFVTGDVETVKRYYAADAVVHYGESLHNRDDIINRLNYCQAIYTEQQHFILDVVTFGNSIIFRDKQQGRSKENRVCRDARERFTPSLVQIDSHYATAN